MEHHEKKGCAPTALKVVFFGAALTAITILTSAQEDHFSKDDGKNWLISNGYEVAPQSTGKPVYFKKCNNADMGREYTIINNKRLAEKKIVCDGGFFGIYSPD